MTEQEFINKWKKWKEINAGYWGATAHRVFWARSYEMPFDKLAEMSRDYISIPDYHRPGDSSFNLAQNTLRQAELK